MAMMDCPRCGFTQPKDRYCANCGLDTESYQPQPEPVTSKLMKSPVFYVAAVVVLIFALGVFITKVTEPENPTQVQESFDFPEPEAIEETAPENMQARSAPEPTRPPPPPQPQPSQQDTSPPAPPPSPATPPPTDVRAEAAVTEETASATAAKLPTQIQFQFYEFPRAALRIAAQESQVISEGDQYRILLHPDQEKLTEWLKTGRRLPGSQSTSVREGATLFANYEQETPGDSLSGLNLDAVINRVTPLGLTIEFRGQYQPQSETASPVRFSTSATMTSDSSLLIFGVVTLPEDGEAEILPQPNSPLTILESPDFADKLSEFVVVLQLK